MDILRIPRIGYALILALLVFLLVPALLRDRQANGVRQPPPFPKLLAPRKDPRLDVDFWLATARRDPALWESALRFCRDHPDLPNCSSLLDAYWHRALNLNLSKEHYEP